VVHPERARRELLVIGDTVRARSVETRDDLPRGGRPGYRRDLHPMRAARPAFSD
jgi:hypothetical protein